MALQFKLFILDSRMAAAAAVDLATQPRYDFFVVWKCRCCGYKEVLRDFDNNADYDSIASTQNAAYEFCKKENDSPENEHTNEEYTISIFQKSAQLIVRYEINFYKFSDSEEEEEGEEMSELHPQQREEQVETFITP